LAYANYHETKCNEFYISIIKKADLQVGVVAGYSKLVEVDVRLTNGWTDFYGGGINNIIHASKNI